MWQYNYMNELYHHGILGMKWGVRRFQNKDGSYTNEGKKRRDSKMFEQNIKSGKDKAPVSPAEKITQNTKSGINDISRIYNSASNIRNQKKKSVDLSNMSNDDLKKAIDRMALEQRYSDLVNNTKKGKDYIDDIINIAGATAGIAGSIVGTIALLKKVK